MATTELLLFQICLDPKRIPPNETRKALYADLYESLLSFISEQEDIPSGSTKCTADAIKEASIVYQATSTAISRCNRAFSLAISVFSRCIMRGRLNHNHSFTPNSGAGDSQLSSDACVSVLQALVSLAGKKDFRSLFQQRISSSPKEKKGDENSAAAPVVLLLSIVRHPKCTAKEKQWALAVCMNASLDEPSVIKLIHESGGTVLILALLSSQKGEESKCIGYEVRKNAAGLLSRLVCHEIVLSMISQPPSFRILVQVLARCTSKLESIQEKPVDGDIEEHIVRILARTLRETQNINELLNAALEENLVISLASLLPKPGCDALTKSVCIC